MTSVSKNEVAKGVQMILAYVGTYEPLIDGKGELCVCGTDFAEDIYNLTRERVGVNYRQELESGTTRA